MLSILNSVIKSKTHFMSISLDKDHYATLGVSSFANQGEIDQAYHALAAQWHPEKHLDNRTLAQRKFSEINEAYFILSNPTRRENYDKVKRGYTLPSFTKTYDKGFQETASYKQQEKPISDKYYPEQSRSYYEVLGVPRTATLSEISNNYRNLSQQYNPTFSTDRTSEQRFREINEAFNQLSDDAKRRNYDDFRFGNMVPTTKSIINDFFGDRPFRSENDNIFNIPLRTSEFEKQFDRDWKSSFGPSPFSSSTMSSSSIGSAFQPGMAESYISSTSSVGPQQAVIGKNVSERVSVVNGQRQTIRTEEIIKADGTKEVTETVIDGGEIRKNKYSLAPGEYRAIGHY